MDNSDDDYGDMPEMCESSGSEQEDNDEVDDDSDSLHKHFCGKFHHLFYESPQFGPAE